MQVPSHAGGSAQARGSLQYQQLLRGTLAGATLEEMMEVSVTEPLSADEEALCSRLVRRSTQDGHHNRWSGKAQGIQKHIYITLTSLHTPVPRVPSADAAERTQRRRRHDIMGRRVSMSGTSGDAYTQL